MIRFDHLLDSALQMEKTTSSNVENYYVVILQPVIQAFNSSRCSLGLEEGL